MSPCLWQLNKKNKRSPIHRWRAFSFIYMHYINSSLNKTKPPGFNQGGFLLLFLTLVRPVLQTMGFCATRYYYVVKGAQAENILVDIPQNHAQHQ